MKTCLVLGLAGVGTCIVVATCQVLPSLNGAGASSAALIGQARKDFGVFSSSDAPDVLEHRFVLTNTMARPIRVQKITSTCGCTEALASPDVVGPGQDLFVDVTVRVRRAGLTAADIWLNLGEDGIQPLHVKARVNAESDMFTSAEAVIVEPGGQAELLIVAVSRVSRFPPADVLVTTPPGIDSTVSGWRLVVDADEATARPARWHARVAFRRGEGTELDRRAAAVIRVGPDFEERVNMTGWPQ